VVQKQGQGQERGRVSQGRTEIREAIAQKLWKWRMRSNDKYWLVSGIRRWRKYEDGAPSEESSVDCEHYLGRREMWARYQCMGDSRNIWKKDEWRKETLLTSFLIIVSDLTNDYKPSYDFSTGTPT
jgi:hypothetical protein